jgi:hypothetical protein
VVRLGLDLDHQEAGRRHGRVDRTGNGYFPQTVRRQLERSSATWPMSAKRSRRAPEPRAWLKPATSTSPP